MTVTGPTEPQPATVEPGLLRNVTIGVDLGQRRDFTAIAVVERVEAFTGRRLEPSPWREETRELESHHHVVHLERAAIGTPYPTVVEMVCELLNHPPLREAKVVIDSTGVGNAVADMFRAAYRRDLLGTTWPVEVTLTGGTERNGSNVPKRELISNLVALSQTGRLRFAQGLALADQMRHELTSFEVKINQRGSARFEARRESDHDDLVIAVALGCFFEHRRVVPRGLRADGSLVDRDYLEAR